MRASRTLARSLAREIVQYTLLGFAAASVVLLSQNLLRRMDELTSIGLTTGDLLVVLRCLFPMLTAYTIPIALLFGTALAIRRRVNDSELLAMRACGLGRSTLLLPVLGVGLAVTAASAGLLLGVEHEARLELIRLFNSLATRGAVLQAGDFRGVGNRVIYVARRFGDDRLEGVMISDRSQEPPVLILADRGRLDLDERSATLHLELGEGEMHIASDAEDPERYRRVLFGSFEYVLDISSLQKAEGHPVRPKQMTLPQLREVVARGRAGDPLRELKKQEPVLYELEIHRRFALPWAPLVFGVAAIPLALRPHRSSRAWAMLACAVLGFTYYAVLTLLQYLSRLGWLPPVLALWLPNAALLALAVWALARSERVPSA